MPALYDTIGTDYATRRRPDPRIAAMIHAHLGDAKTVVNVGAGAGSYEPAQLSVTAVEPSARMIAQRPKNAAPCVQAGAEELPFDDDAFDAAMAILTVHHWSDQNRGLTELRRVSRGPVVILTFDPFASDFWLFDYLPELLELDRRAMPRLAVYQEALGSCQVHPLPVPHDCVDGFLCAFWRRPAAYLNPHVRASMSSFSLISGADHGLKRLEKDLQSGAWQQRYGALLGRPSLDCGYRLVVSG